MREIDESQELMNDFEAEAEVLTETLRDLYRQALGETAHLRAILRVCPGCAHFDPENPEEGCVTQAALTHPYCARRTERARRVACG